MLDPADTVKGAIAELDGRAVGIVHFIEHRSCWSAKDSFYLQDLFTDESVRGRVGAPLCLRCCYRSDHCHTLKGIGRALINHVVAVARERGIGKVHWLTHETNTTAQILYDKVHMHRMMDVALLRNFTQISFFHGLLIHR